MLAVCVSRDTSMRSKKMTALDSRQKMIGEGQLRRTRKGLMDLALVILEEKETGSAFPRDVGSLDAIIKPRITSAVLLDPQSLYLGVCLNLGQQLQSIASHLAAPGGYEIAATNGIASLIFTIAAVPCQDRSLQIHFSIPRQYSWSNGLWLLHGRIMDEAKKSECRNK